MRRVLFVCVENSCRSQMAEGLARYFGEGIVEVCSAGSKPSGKVSPDAVKVMREIGIDISRQTSKGFTELPFDNFDYVISMGCKDACPSVPAERHIEWDIEDPKGKDIDFFRFTRDKIKGLVADLIDSVANLKKI
jgi:arsenate reductase